MTAQATSRYVAADFKNTPLLALADLMGLRQYQAQIGASPEIFAPILNGLAVYRYLSGPQRVDVMRSIYFDFPRGNLTSRLVGLATDLSVQPYWYMWSLSDEDLLEFFSFSTGKAEISGQFNPLSLPELTVASVAGGVYGMSRQGPRAVVKEHIERLRRTELVEAVAKRLGFGTRLASGIGVASIPSFIVISGLNIMAKRESEKARRELAARGLLVYGDL